MTATASRSPSALGREHPGGAEVDRVELLTLAESTAMTAAGVIRDSEMTLDPSLKGNGEGLVTSLDHAVERCIREALIAARPEDGFYGEESAPVAGESGVEWIVDPIDGTNNLIAGLPHWSISIAASVCGRVEVGVVHAPALGWMYGASRGGVVNRGVVNRGGFQASGPPRPSVANLHDAVVATGFASDPRARAEQMEQLGRVVGEVRDVRCHGAASLELCGVACGRLDAYYETGLRPWDVAAAALIAIEAGIEVSGQPWSGAGTLIAAVPTLAGPLRCLVDPPGTHG